MQSMAGRKVHTLVTTSDGDEVILSMTVMVSEGLNQTIIHDKHLIIAAGSLPLALLSILLVSTMGF